MVASTQFITILVTLFSFQCLPGNHSTTLTMVNKYSDTVRLAISSAAGTPPLSITGFVLQPGESKTVVVSPDWSGRIWGRTLCPQDTTGKFSCVTGDCSSSTVECAGGNPAPPATVAEFILNGSGGLNFFAVSLVDGFNIPMTVEPQGGTVSGNCMAAGCTVDLNSACPTELKVISGGEVVGCMSACEAFGDPQYCCTGAYATPETCKPSYYSQFFKEACPCALTYAYDDTTVTFFGPSAHYLLTFHLTYSTSSREPRNSGGQALIKIVISVVGVFVTICGICGIYLGCRMRFSPNKRHRIGRRNKAS